MMQLMDILRENLPLLLPLFALQILLLAAALWDLTQRPSTRGPRWMWVLIILFVNILGPIAYFVIGREDS
jgi:hypothetical protein